MGWSSRRASTNFPSNSGGSGEDSGTTTTRSEFASELETIREEGYATDANEVYDGIYCIATSITITRDDELAGAISVTGLTNRFSDEEYRDRQSPYLAARFRYRPTRIRTWVFIAVTLTL